MVHMFSKSTCINQVKYSILFDYLLVHKSRKNLRMMEIEKGAPLNCLPSKIRRLRFHIEKCNTELY